MSGFGRLHRIWNPEPRVLDAEARRDAPGQFVDLPAGTVHYHLEGPKDGQTVVLVHGVSVPCWVWEPTAQALSQAGFRVLRYDLYGRGYSDRPCGPYDRDLFERQLEHLVGGLNLRTPVDLVGLSMGGAVAVGYTERYPERVRRLGLIDPAGLGRVIPLSAKLIQAPILGELLVSIVGERVLMNRVPQDLHDPSLRPEYVRRYRTQMAFQGFRRAILSTLRYSPLQGMEAAYREVGRQGRPVILFWGTEDATIPFDTHRLVLDAIPQARFHAVQRARHVPHYEHPEVVNPLLIDFLR